MGQNQTCHYISMKLARWQHQLESDNQCLVEFIRMWHRGQSVLSIVALFLAADTVTTTILKL